MPADKPDPAPENEDLKSKFKEALERKQSHDKVAEEGHQREGKPHSTHGPQAKQGFKRRKTG